MLRKDAVIIGIIHHLDANCNGVLIQGNDAVYVRHVIAGEKVKVRIQKRIPSGYSAVLLEVLKAAPQRVQPSCPIYDCCGSCHLLHMQKEAQKQQKLRYLRQLCAKTKGLRLDVTDIAVMPQPYHYRNKMIIGFQKDRRGQLQAGFYEEFSHRIVPYETCVLHPAICDDIVHTIIALMRKLHMEPYDEDKRKGFLRHVVLRYGMASKQVMVVLVVQQAVFPARKAFVQALINKHPMITTIVQNVNTRKTSIVLGEQERVLYGPGYIEDVLCGLNFRISPKSFYQINHAQCEVLYQRAIALLELKGNEVLMDAYCGIGTIGMYAARFVKQVIGVELRPDAVEDAKKNARLNDIANIRFVCDDAGSFMQKLAAKKERLDVVIMDPPRSGSTEQFMRSVAMVKPKQVLYISCDPQTQMRDLQVFRRLGYEGDELHGVDMFPLTYAVESIVKLNRVERKHQAATHHKTSSHK